MSEDKSLVLLKRVVKGMGVVLVVGTFALFIAIGIKFQSSSSARTGKQGGCDYSSGGVSVKSEVISATTRGDTLTILTAQDKGAQEVVVVDLCSGNVLSTFVLNDVRFAK